MKLNKIGKFYCILFLMNLTLKYSDIKEGSKMHNEAGGENDLSRNEWLCGGCGKLVAFTTIAEPRVLFLHRTMLCSKNGPEDEASFLLNYLPPLDPVCSSGHEESLL